ncbi:hypothetical protein D3C87_2009050 [compost metagenome]
MSRLNNYFVLCKLVDGLIYKNEIIAIQVRIPLVENYKLHLFKFCDSIENYQKTIAIRMIEEVSLKAKILIVCRQ